MHLQVDSSSEALRKTVILSIFGAVAVVLSIVESIIPFFSVPGAKLGLSNIMVLTCLYFFKGRDTFTLIVLKTILTAIIFGTFSSFLFSFMGSLFSFIVMFSLTRLGKDNFSTIGISVYGGIAHNIGQLAAAFIVIKSSIIFSYLPVLMITGIATGVFIGYATHHLVNSLSKLPLFKPYESRL
ncbi:Gx transporter family protein [Paenibacillus albiflavus]|uniref:Gx transporter family protein n=1 Tax=Paenibacillus albiflavus TaxID=2545760 RepID=A0A4R4E9U3_9BACL|nr:Gx transporter family protein [Paenibacillus albiflavus]TCZ76359.1 Gx transporter family protein [Paenibacillus albiflavus]